LSRAQVARCITQFTDGGAIRDRRRAPAVPFARHYTDEDIRLLAELDGLRGALSGTTTRKLCERALTANNPKQPCPLDRVNRQFKADRPNQLWVSRSTGSGLVKEHGVRSSKGALRCLSGLTAAFELD